MSSSVYGRRGGDLSIGLHLDVNCVCSVIIYLNEVPRQVENEK